MNDEILFTLARFPDDKDRILIDYFRDEDFKTLVEDFFSAAEKLKGCQSRVTSDKKYETEYQIIFQELEKEIILHLQRKNSSEFGRG